MKYSTYQQLNPPIGFSYKFLQLPSDVIDFLKTGQDELCIKSSETNDDLVLCSGDKTWKIKQMNHTNTALLMKEVEKSDSETDSESFVADKNLVGLSSLSYEYELTQFQGKINIENLPVYDGTKESMAYKQDITLEDLIDNSPISRGQFFTKWHLIGGCEVDGRAVVLADTMIVDFLTTFLTLIISEKIDYNDDSVFTIDLEKFLPKIVQENPKFTPSMINSLGRKFCFHDEDENMFRPNNLAIAKWFGIITLINNSNKLLDIKEFYLQWKSVFPPFYNVPIDISQLRGYYFQPLAGKIQYLNESTLSNSDIHSRIKELFKLAKEWEFDDFLPYIERFIPPGKKVESILLKYAKKKRVGKKFMVGPR